MYLTLVYYADILVNKGSKCTNNKTDEEFLPGSNNLLGTGHDSVHHDETRPYFG